MNQIIKKVTWSSPSNIALVKYWGKHGNQLPKNASISFTLKHSLTTLSVAATPMNSHSKVRLRFYFHGEIKPLFEEKIAKFLTTQIERFPWLLDHELEIRSSNTFPHSSGIASSASSMSALCLSLLSIDESIKGNKGNTYSESFFQSASELSRLASGSASRSVYPGMASWGDVTGLGLFGTSDLFASEFKDQHSLFHDFCDSILIVDDQEKSVSSRAGHSLMNNHPFASKRYERATRNLERLIGALKSGDLPTFIEVVEEEALMLHALMMTSHPSYILLKPGSLLLIDKIRTFREQKNIPVCFTIDAGPNIHLLYPKAYKTQVLSFIENELANDLMGQKWIHDEVGTGPVQVEANL